MSSNKTIESIKSNDLFKGLDFASLNVPFDAKNFLEFKEGDLIYSSGQPSDFIYLLINGEVKVKLNSIKRLFFKSQNEFFGETEVMQKEPRSSSALANSDCLIYKIGQNLVNKMLNDSSSFSGNLMQDNKQDVNEIHVEQTEPERINNKTDIKLNSEPNLIDINNLVSIKPKYETSIDLDKIEIKHFEQEPDLDAFIQQKYLDNDNKSLKSNMLDDLNDMTNWVITEGSLEEVSEKQTQIYVPKKTEVINNISSTEDFGNETTSESSNIESFQSQLSSEVVLTSENFISELSQVSNFIMQDVKSPLLTIKHYSSILSRFDLPEEVKRVVSLISSQTNSVIDLLQSSIDFSEKNTKTKLELVSFNEVMNNNLTLLSDYVESRNVKLFKKLADDVKVKIDTRKFYVACYYVSRFACDMMKHGGNLYFSSQIEDAKVVLHIKDGNKIDSKELLEKVFDPGFTNSNNENLGLSLAIAKFLIEAMQGALELQPSDTGTSYIVSIPVSL